MDEKLVAKIIFGLNNYETALEFYNNLKNTKDLLDNQYSGIFEKLIIFNGIITENECNPKILNRDIIKDISGSDPYSVNFARLMCLLRVYNKLLTEMYDLFGKLFVLLDSSRIPNNESDVLLILDELAKIIKKYSIDTNDVQITEIIFRTEKYDSIRFGNY